VIIGLSGLKNSGKDTVAAYLVKEHGFERKAFADPLKQSVAALFNIPFSEVDKLKNDTDVAVEIRLFTQGVSSSLQPEYRAWSFREFLQRYGTESHREVFGMDFWVDYTLPVQGFYPGRAIVVTDVRFENEADRVRFLGGSIWYVDRGQESTDEHVSEQFDFVMDRIIENTGTVMDLYERVEELLALTPTNS